MKLKDKYAIKIVSTAGFCHRQFEEQQVIVSGMCRFNTQIQLSIVLIKAGTYWPDEE